MALHEQMDKYISVRLFMLTVVVFMVEAYSLSRRFIKNEKLGFRQLEGTDTPSRSIIECAAMCSITRCFNLYYKHETQKCNLKTNYAVFPISNPQENWIYYADTKKGTNLALYKTATQSSTYKNATHHEAFYAVDGQVAQIESGLQTTHTEMEKQPWLNIDLGSTNKIDQIVIYNRQDMAGYRLRYFRVDVIQNTEIRLCGYFNYESKTAETVIIMCHDEPEGSEIRIMLTLEGYLSLSEVEVFGWI